MKNFPRLQTNPPQVSTSKISLRGAGIALGFAILLAVVTNPAAQAQTFTVLHSFTGSPKDGKISTAGLARDASGNLYGTTQQDGAYGGGTVFKLSTKSKETILHNFRGKDGLSPWGGVVLASGNLYGTTHDGGAHSKGVVFKLNRAGKETVLYSFAGGADGGNPSYSNLVVDETGNVYGTTVQGGNSGCPGGKGCGVVFKVDRAGKETVLYTFSGGADGALPFGTLVRDAVGNLYGTTEEGGANNYGTVFKLDTTGAETVLYSFGGGPNGPDGAYPIAGLVRDAAGNLYGTTGAGGAGGIGTVFNVDKTGEESVLYAFRAGSGGIPLYGSLVRDAAGSLYGTTLYGGSGEWCVPLEGCGVVFKVDKTGKEMVLHEFTGHADGAYPYGGLIRDAAGNLYGTNTAGGDSGKCRTVKGGCGVMFKITPDANRGVEGGPSKLRLGGDFRG
jgi:uncharacterized repeat protein (TIGR03803 family)